MKITRETDHAVKCVQYLAKYPEQCLTVSTIAKKANIPRAFLAKIIQKLAKANVVKSVQGAQGGFMLAQKPSEINLKKIVETIQGSIHVKLGPDDCSSNPVHSVWNRINNIIAKELQESDFNTLSQDPSHAVPC